MPEVVGGGEERVVLIKAVFFGELGAGGVVDWIFTIGGTAGFIETAVEIFDRVGNVGGRRGFGRGAGFLRKDGGDAEEKENEREEEAKKELARSEGKRHTLELGEGIFIFVKGVGVLGVAIERVLILGFEFDGGEFGAKERTSFEDDGRDDVSNQENDDGDEGDGEAFGLKKAGKIFGHNRD